MMWGDEVTLKKMQWSDSHSLSGQDPSYWSRGSCSCAPMPFSLVLSHLLSLAVRTGFMPDAALPLQGKWLGECLMFKVIESGTKYY